MKQGPGTKPRAGVGLTSVMVALTLTTGMIEAVSFLVLGPVFTAVQTGNLLFLSFALTGAVGLSPAAALVSFAGFTVGAVLGSRFESSVDAHGRRWFVAALIVEALLLGLGGLVAWRTGVDATGAPADAPHFAVVALVAGAMGVRNVTTLRARVADVPTTVSTRALTALLSGLPPHPDSRIGAGPRGRGPPPRLGHRDVPRRPAGRLAPPRGGSSGGRSAGARSAGPDPGRGVLAEGTGGHQRARLNRVDPAEPRWIMDA